MVVEKKIQQAITLRASNWGRFFNATLEEIYGMFNFYESEHQTWMNYDHVLSNQTLKNTHLNEK